MSALITPTVCSTSGRLSPRPPAARQLAFSAARRPLARRMAVSVQAYTATVRHEGVTHVIEVPEGDSILQACQDNGIDVPYDCSMGTCCACAARLISGDMDVSAGMIEPEVADKGYVLLCTALPQSDVVVETIDQNELFVEVMGIEQ